MQSYKVSKFLIKPEYLRNAGSQPKKEFWAWINIMFNRVDKDRQKIGKDFETFQKYDSPELKLEFFSWS